MRYSIEFTTSALREFKALDRTMQRRIGGKISDLGVNPFPPDTKRLQGEPGHFRIRTGDYRVIYRLDGRRVVIVVVRIGHRKDVYS
jgi:mRNA interferase RelE/StbE